MFYPVYLRLGDDTHAHGVTFPDFPGCFATAGRLEALPHSIQEAAETHFAGRAAEIPPPTALEKLMQDPAYRDGVWMLVDIDVAKLGSFPAAEGALEVKTGEIAVSDQLGEADFARIAVTLPDDLLKLIDEYAGKRQLSRSAVVARAAMMFLTSSG